MTHPIAPTPTLIYRGSVSNTAVMSRQHGIVALSSNYTLYSDMGDRIMAALPGFSPQIEVYSIDECFVSLKGLGHLWTSPAKMGPHNIRWSTA